MMQRIERFNPNYKHEWPLPYTQCYEPLWHIGGRKWIYMGQVYWYAITYALGARDETDQPH